MKQLLLFCFFLISFAASAQTNATYLLFDKGESQVVAAFSDPDWWIKEEVWVETEFDSDLDGRPDRMHVYITRPLQTQTEGLKLPVIYNSSPYFGLRIPALLGIGSKKNFWKVNHELGATPKPHRHMRLGTRTKRPLFASSMDRTWVPRGYVMVYSSSPGTGLSDGVPTIGGQNESLAPKAVIDWLGGRAKAYRSRTGKEEVKAYWSTGKVGMTGTSYDGTLCLAAATTGVEGLEAIIPVAPVSSFYQYYRSNGLVRSPGGYLGEDADVLYDMINSGDKKKRKANNRRVRDSLLVPGQDRITGDFNDFWAERDYVPQMGNMRAALLMAHGFNDWNVMPEHSYRFYQAAKERGIPTQLYYHQWGHGGDPPLSQMNRWFTRYLHGIDNGVENDTAVYIVREGARKPTAYRQYPDSTSSPVRLFFAADGSQQGRLVSEATSGQMPLSFTDDHRRDMKALLTDAYAVNRLLFVTAPLKQELRLSGVSQIKVSLTASKPAANFSAYLVLLPLTEGKNLPDYENLVTRGWADPQNHRDLRKQTPLVPGQFVDLRFELMPDDQVIPAGRQIGLLLFSSDKEFTLHPKPGTVLTIEPAGCELVLPVVGGSAAWKAAFE